MTCRGAQKSLLIFRHSYCRPRKALHNDTVDIKTSLAFQYSSIKTLMQDHNYSLSCIELCGHGFIEHTAQQILHGHRGHTQPCFRRSTSNMW